MTRVLLVTGSRSLADHPGAEAWARALIRTALAGVDLLIVGDAPGPDAFAVGIARIMEVPTSIYDTRTVNAGWVVDADSNRQFHWTAARPPTGTRGWKPWLLSRNEAMVSDAAKMLQHGHDVRCLALLDGTKRDAPGRRATRGTEHTAGLAERAGLSVQREVWRGR